VKSVVTLNIHGPRAKVAALFADPENSTKWMDDVRYEPLSGAPGQVGSRYRLLSKDSSMDFTATVVARDLPDKVRLHLEGTGVDVAITDTFTSPADDETQLVSEEVFRFKGLVGRLKGMLAGPVIRKAHRRHMEAFKRFAEQTR
jgi:hypothetical protein